MAPNHSIVLLADADPSVRHALRKFLVLRGLNVVSTSSVDDALDAIVEHRPAAAIVDLQLPGGSGRDVVVSMPPRAPVIIFSSAPHESCKLEELRPRTRLQPKPHSLLMLIETLQEMLGEVQEDGGSGIRD
jgi:DNA-binding response OmpR family regulator